MYVAGRRHVNASLEDAIAPASMGAPNISSLVLVRCRIDVRLCPIWAFFLVGEAVGRQGTLLHDMRLEFEQQEHKGYVKKRTQSIDFRRPGGCDD